ncbi:p53 and DNA damage-regulated protein 1 isoform X2 [Conger conger]|uniref:p53 and DNA damage-regulated protein 1 isoform X2 n=1 Tax=Conger conger TaxID=82655 RepID=UPI002A59AE62|nr:p53 and DNA damage-regulated protein 1 isoform X2 [Conger conger]
MFHVVVVSWSLGQSQSGDSNPQSEYIMDDESQHILKYLTEIEVAAEDVLSDKQQMVDLDVKRHRNREALSALRDVSQQSEGKPELTGYNLSPLTSDEIKAIHSLLKR